MNAKRITRSAALLALLTALAVPAGPAQAAGPAPRNTDFNGDGYNDLALGMPNHRGEDGSWNRGMVTVLYGGPNGFDGHWTHRPAVGCTTANGERCYAWGKSVAAGDVDADGRTDLVFTADEGTRVQSWTPQGVTEIEYREDFTPFSALVGPMVGQFDDRPGSDIVGAWHTGSYESVVGGWYNRDASAITQGFDIPDSDVRVNAAATGDVDGDGRLEMSVVAVRRYNGQDSAYLWLLKDVRKQPLDVSDRAWGWEALCKPGNRNVLGCPKPDSRVAMGDVDGNGHLDVVMATPSTRSLQIWYGSASGPTTHPGFSAHDLDWFDPNGYGLLGRGLAVGDVNGDGAAEIAIGSPQATSSGQSRAGAVVLIPGSTGGPVLANAQLITQDGVGPVTPPVPAPTPAASVTPSTGPVPTVTPTPAPVPAASVTPSTGPVPTVAPEPTVTFDPKSTSEPQSFTAPRAVAALPDPIDEQSQVDDFFGEEVKIIDITGDGKGEVLIGAPGKNWNYGMLTVLRGTANGVSTTAAQIVHPGQLGVIRHHVRFGGIMAH